MYASINIAVIFALQMDYLKVHIIHKVTSKGMLIKDFHIWGCFSVVYFLKIFLYKKLPSYDEKR